MLCCSKRPISGRKKGKKNVLIFEFKKGKSDYLGNCNPTKWVQSSAK